MRSPCPFIWERRSPPVARIALGFLPALLVHYALLPILRNAVTTREHMVRGMLEAAFSFFVSKLLPAQRGAREDPSRSNGMIQKIMSD